MRYCLLLLLLIISCSPGQSSVPEYETMTIFDYMQLPDSRINVGVASLILAKEIYPEINITDYRDKIKTIASWVLVAAGKGTEPGERITAINKVLYHQYGFTFDIDDFNGKLIENHMLPKVLDRRKGVCTTLPLLYIVVAEELKYPICAVSAPEHTFCRYVYVNKKGRWTSINIEATSYGKSIPDVMYIEYMKIPKDAYRHGVYLKTLSKREYIGTLIGMKGVYYRVYEKDYRKALRYFLESLKWNKRQSHICYFLSYLCYEIHNNKIDIGNDYTMDQIYLMHNHYYDESYRLGMAPRAPKDYWKDYLSKDNNGEKVDLVVKVEDGIRYVADRNYENEVNRLELKYHDYFY